MSADTNAWFPRAGESQAPALRVFCFPHAGGGTSTFRPWRKAAPPGWEICAVRLPGRESRLNEPAIRSAVKLVNEIATAIQPLLDVPFVFFGHSMGGLLAFELARKLYRETRKLPEHLFISAFSGPPYSHPHLTTLLMVPDDLFLERLCDWYGGAFHHLRSNRELRELILPTLRADFALVESHPFTPSEPLPCPLTCYGGQSDTFVSEAALKRWRSQTSESFRVRLFPGGHLYFEDHNESLLDHMVKAIVREPVSTSTTLTE